MLPMCRLLVQFNIAQLNLDEFSFVLISLFFDGVVPSLSRSYAAGSTHSLPRPVVGRELTFSLLSSIREWRSELLYQLVSAFSLYQN